MFDDINFDPCMDEDDLDFEMHYAAEQLSSAELDELTPIQEMD